MTPRPRPSLTVLAFVIALPSAACASILDFEDARDRPVPFSVDDANPDLDDAGGRARTRLPLDGATMDARASTDDISPLVEICSASCLTLPPDGWQGPLAVHVGSGAVSTEACSGDYAVGVYQGFADPVAAAAACECSCAAPAGVTCAAPMALFFKDKNCTQTCGTVTSQTLTAGACTPLAPDSCTGNSGRYVLTPSTAAGGTCDPVATSAIADARWSSSVRLCATTRAMHSASCGAGRVCAPGSQAPGERNRCIARAGQWTCPAAYPHARTFHESATDTRACTSCSCGAPAGTTCQATVRTYDVLAIQCLGVATTASLPSACAPIDMTHASATVSASTGGACVPAGGVPMGDYLPGSPTTVCCLETP